MCHFYIESARASHPGHRFGSRAQPSAELGRVCVPVVSPTLVKPVAYVLSCLPVNRMGAAGLLPPPSFHSAGLLWLYSFIGAFPLSYFLPEFIVNNDDSDKR